MIPVELTDRASCNRMRGGSKMLTGPDTKLGFVGAVLPSPLSRPPFVRITSGGIDFGLSLAKTLLRQAFAPIEKYRSRGQGDKFHLR
jgi:hypothetical protein